MSMTIGWRKYNTVYMRLVFVLLASLLTILVGVALHYGTAAFAAENVATVHEVRTLYPDEWGAPRRFGLAYSTRYNRLFLVKQGKRGLSTTTGTSVIVVTPQSQLVESVELAYKVGGELTAAFDDQNNRLLLFNLAANELVQVSMDGTGHLDPKSLTPVNIGRFRLKSASGMDINEQTNTLSILDGQAAQIIQIQLTPQLPNAVEKVRLNLGANVVNKLNGLAIHPQTQHFMTMDGKGKKILEFDQNGQQVNTYDLSGLDPNNPTQLVIAPSGDLTDDPSVMHLYISDSREVVTTADYNDGVETENLSNRLYLPLISQATNDEEASAASTTAPKHDRYGELIEVSLTPSGFALQAASLNTLPLRLVQTIATYAFTPPSPDPSGLFFDPVTNQLRDSDAEIDEMPALFTGKNIFNISLPKTLADMASTTNYTTEPTDISYNPANGHYFMSDDDWYKVYEVSKGADNILGTADDSTTSFPTSAFNSYDPEGITYDPTSHDLFIADGLNAEVYRVNAGPNGVFDGIAAVGGDDIVTNFDSLALGIEDPEGIYFDTSSGNLFMTGKSVSTIFELTTAGVLVQTYDVSAANAVKFASVTIGPSSEDASRTSIYIADRRIDNNSDPAENDGEIYEFSTLLAAPTPTPVATLSLLPYADSRVQDSNPTTNYGTSPRISARSPGPTYNGYLKFQVTGITGPVQSAKLHLYVYDGSILGGSIFAVSNNYANSSTPWTESGLTWQNAPPISGTALSTLGLVATGTWVDFDVTSAITGNGTFSFGINDPTINTVDYNSKEATSNKPFLIIEVGNNATPTATSTPNATPTDTNTATAIPPTDTATAPATATTTLVPPTDTATDTATPVPPTNTETATATAVLPTATATAIDTATPVPPTNTETATATALPPTATATATATPVPPTSTATATATAVPPTATATATATLVPPTSTATATATAVPPTATATATATPVPPTSTATATATAVPPTATATATATPVPPTSTATATATAVPPTATATATATPVPPTSTATATATRVPPTNTATATATRVPPTNTATATATRVPPTNTATATATRVPPTNTATATATRVPSTATPTATSASLPTLSISPAADARVQNDSPTSNFGTSSRVSVRAAAPVYNSYFKFQVSGITKRVQSAKLRLYVIDRSNLGGTIYTVSNNYLNSTTPWTETGLTWQNAPAISGNGLSTVGTAELNLWIEFDVTAAIQSNGTYSFGITSSSTNMVDYNSKEATSNRPVLVIVQTP